MLTKGKDMESINTRAVRRPSDCFDSRCRNQHLVGYLDSSAADPGRFVTQNVKEAQIWSLHNLRVRHIVGPPLSRSRGYLSHSCQRLCHKYPPHGLQCEVLTHRRCYLRPNASSFMDVRTFFNAELDSNDILTSLTF